MKTATKQRSETLILAARYGVSARTVQNWRQNGAPLHDPVRLDEWLASRKHCPHKRPGRTGAAPQSPPSSPLLVGVAAALRRLETSEAAAYQRLENALLDENPIGVRLARESWLKIVDSLRKYESAVDHDMRERGVTVSRAEVEASLQKFAWFLQTTAEGSMPGLLHSISPESDPVRLRQVVRRCGWHTWISSLAVAKSSVPDWIVKALGSHLDSELKGGIWTDVEKLYGSICSQLGIEAAQAADRSTPHFNPVSQTNP